MKLRHKLLSASTTVMSAFVLTLSNAVKADDAADCLEHYKNKHYASALSECEMAGQAGNAISQLILGNMYRKGMGVERSYKTSVYWFKLASEQGYAPAQAVLAFMYANGDGVKKDYVRAQIWFNISAINEKLVGTNKPSRTNKPSQVIEKTVTEAMVLSNLTQEQRMNAQEVAKQCIAKKYENCD